MNYRVLYFASLRDQAGRDMEQVTSTAADAQSLYVELAQRHGFLLPQSRLRVAVNGEFATWGLKLLDDDEVVFLPPVSGG